MRWGLVSARMARPSETRKNLGKNPEGIVETGPLLDLNEYILDESFGFSTIAKNSSCRIENKAEISLRLNTQSVGVAADHLR
jgi:hypothetical protein